MKMVEDMARHVDAGFDGPEAIYWSRLIYIPHPKMLNKNVSTKVKEWVRLSEFEIALDEQMEKIKQIVIKSVQCCDAIYLSSTSGIIDGVTTLIVVATFGIRAQIQLLSLKQQFRPWQ